MSGHVYEPGDPIEVVCTAGEWHGPRYFVGLARVVYETEMGICCSRHPEYVRPAPVTHELTVTLTDAQAKAAASWYTEINPSTPGNGAHNAFVEAARKAVAS